MIAATVFLPVFAAFYIWLSFFVIGKRRAAKVGLGDGGNEPLQRAQRMQGNFAEYVPLTAIVLVVLELQVDGWLTPIVWLLWLTLLVGRGLHAYGISSQQAPGWARYYGMVATFAALASAAAALFVFGLIG